MEDRAKTDLRYFGTDIMPRIGDRLRYDDTTEDLIVVDIVDTPEGLKRLGLTSFGVMMRTENGALVFDTMDAPDLEFVTRKQ